MENKGGLTGCRWSMISSVMEGGYWLGGLASWKVSARGVSTKAGNRGQVFCTRSFARAIRMQYAARVSSQTNHRNLGIC